MDDWMVLAPTRWRLRKAVALVNRIINGLPAVQHPDKTFIGRISRGFDFVIYRISPNGLKMATQTVLISVARICQLYEQRADRLRIGQYVKRWKCWATSARLRSRVVCRVLITAEPKVSFLLPSIPHTCPAMTK